MEDVSALQREIRQAKPFVSRSQHVAGSLLRTADLVRRAVGRVLEPYDITPQQYNVLRILRGAGEQGLPTLEIGERMVEQAPGVTRLLDRLEAKGLVRRERCRVDRRQVLCWIEPAGERLLADLERPMWDAARRRMAGLDPRGLETLISLMEAVRAEPTSRPPESKRNKEILR